MLGRVNWIVVSAIVQGISATLIALLTFFLVKFTSGYVAEMKTLNELQGQANAVSQQLLSLEMEAIRPVSRVTRPPRGVKETVTCIYTVKTVGAGFA